METNGEGEVLFGLLYYLIAFCIFLVVNKAILGLDHNLCQRCK